jgi:hypothetical protein
MPRGGAGQHSPLGFFGNCRNSSGVAFRPKLEWILPGLLWLWLFAHLRAEWTLNSQYNYGWAVPFLGALLFYLRWQRRPDIAVTRQGNRAVVVAGWVLLVLLFPLRVIEEANPDWRFLSWVLALSVSAFSLLALARAGAGRGWPTSLSRFVSVSSRCPGPSSSKTSWSKQ